MALRFGELKDRGFLEEMQLKHGENLVAGIRGEYLKVGDKVGSQYSPERRPPSRVLILLRLKQAGLIAKRVRSFPELWEGDWLEKRVREGLTFKHIAELIPGCSPGSVFYAAKKRDIGVQRGELRRDQPQVFVRLPQEMYDELREMAEKAHKPITKMAEHLLMVKLSEK